MASCFSWLTELDSNKHGGKGKNVSNKGTGPNQTPPKARWGKACPKLFRQASAAVVAVTKRPSMKITALDEEESRRQAEEADGTLAKNHLKLFFIATGWLRKIR